MPACLLSGAVQVSCSICYHWCHHHYFMSLFLLTLLFWHPASRFVVCFCLNLISDWRHLLSAYGNCHMALVFCSLNLWILGGLGGKSNRLILCNLLIYNPVSVHPRIHCTGIILLKSWFNCLKNMTGWELFFPLWATLFSHLAAIEIFP